MKLNVGRIGKAHGILGEATIEVRTDEAENRFAIGAVLETDSHGELTVVSARVHNGILLLGFQGIEDRNSIEALRNELLYAEVDIQAPELMKMIITSYNLLAAPHISLTEMNSELSPMF